MGAKAIPKRLLDVYKLVQGTTTVTDFRDKWEEATGVRPSDDTARDWLNELASLGLFDTDAAGQGRTQHWWPRQETTTT
jgi:hypothetical protein